MKFEYTGRHIEVTPALRTHVEEQFGKLGHLFNSNDELSAHVIMGVEKGRHKSEIILNWRHEILTANTSNSDMYLSLSQTIAKIEKQGLKLKKKIIDKHHRKAKKVGEITANGDESTSAAPAPARIVRTRGYDVKPVSSEEAAMLLQTEENQFLVYRDADTERVSVIYKRKDGNYGLIQP
jgi:putative sigma-54 modulation protein